MVIIAAMAVMLVGATAFATSESAFAGADMDTRRVMRRAKQPAKLMNVATDFCH